MKQPVHSWLRPFSIALVLVLLLVQAYLLYHETEHAAVGESESCVVCQLAQQQGHALPAAVLIIAGLQFYINRSKPSVPFIFIRPRLFAARAPPALN